MRQAPGTPAERGREIEPSGSLSALTDDTGARTMAMTEEPETAPSRAAGEADGAIPMLLFCPVCHLQHVDEPDERTPEWNNPPHRSHLCHGCGCIWRPADVATEGVRSIASVGKADTWTPPAPSEQPAPSQGEIERATLGAFVGLTSASNRKYPDAAEVAGKNFTFLPINRPINFDGLGPEPAPSLSGEVERIAAIIRACCKNGVQPEPFGGSLDTADIAAQQIAALQSTPVEQAGEAEGRTWNTAIEAAAKVADGSYAADKAKEAEYLASAATADSTSGREVDLEYAVSYAQRANGNAAIARAIRALAASPPLTGEAVCDTCGQTNAAFVCSNGFHSPLTGDEGRLREAAQAAIDWLRSAPLESGYCCCGSPVVGHGLGDGHSPVDDLAYSAGQLEERLLAALSPKGEKEA